MDESSVFIGADFVTLRIRGRQAPLIYLAWASVHDLCNTPPHNYQFPLRPAVDDESALRENCALENCAPTVFRELRTEDCAPWRIAHRQKKEEYCAPRIAHHRGELRTAGLSSVRNSPKTVGAQFSSAQFSGPQCAAGF
ncbi:hypothetical protein GPALN_012081 [Globodera pallida]|nr:hypothetical protein GPALN_012081 [Globodera pallida]